MPDNGSGTYSLPPGYKVTNGDVTDASQHNPPFEDIAQALTLRLSRDGRSAWTGNQNANSNKVINLADPTGDQDAVNKRSVWTVVEEAIAAADPKTTPVNADTIPLVDSEDSDEVKQLSVTSLKAVLKTYFDDLYAGKGAVVRRTVTDSTSLAATDAGKTVVMNSASTVRTITIPANGTTAIAADFWCNIENIGAADLTIAAASGVTVNGVSEGEITLEQYQGCTIRKDDTNSWRIPNFEAESP